MKKQIVSFIIYLMVLPLFAMESDNKEPNMPLKPNEINRLAELMVPIYEGQLLNQNENDEFSLLMTKIRIKLENRKKELGQPTIQKDFKPNEQK